MGCWCGSHSVVEEACCTLRDVEKLVPVDQVPVDGLRISATLQLSLEKQQGLTYVTTACNCEDFAEDEDPPDVDVGPPGPATPELFALASVTTAKWEFLGLSRCHRTRCKESGYFRL